MNKRRTKLLVGSLAVLLSSFTNLLVAQESDKDSVGFLLVGDTGYHHDFLSPKDYYLRAKTEQQGQAYFYNRWIAKNRSFKQFRFPRFSYVPEIGGYVQTSGLYPVSSAMSAYCEEHDCQFAVMLGDNIYDKGATLGEDGRDDNERFKAMFDQPFADLGKGNDDFKIYVTLGNHDWGTSREGALLQVEYHQQHPKFYMDGLFYTVKPPAGNGEVELFVVDTQLLLNANPVYRMHIDEQGFEHQTDRERKRKPFHLPANKAERNMVQWLERAMKKSTAKWKFIIAHHPMWSSSGAKATDNTIIRNMLLPVACQYADGYFAGHDHTLEITLDTCESVIRSKKEVPPLLHVISGAGAKLRPIDQRYVDAQATQFPQRKDVWQKSMEWGFTYMHLSGDELTIKMVTVPYSGAMDMETDFEYKFKHRSNWDS